MSNLVDAFGNTIERTELDPKPFASLLVNKNDLPSVFAYIQAAIYRSFRDDAVREKRTPCITEGEIKHRFKLCEDFFRHCRCELGYSTQKTLDLMAYALRKKLDGEDFDPNKTINTRLWSAL